MKKSWLQDWLDETPALQIAPLIDCVFLLLIYFMVTSSLRKQEADLGITLPGTIQQAKSVAMPDEQIIEIDDRGRVMLNSMQFGRNGERLMPDLVATLVRYRQAATAAQTKALVTIQAGDDSLHQRTIDVMNACAAAGIKNISFGMGD